MKKAKRKKWAGFNLLGRNFFFENCEGWKYKGCFTCSFYEVCSNPNKLPPKKNPKEKEEKSSK